MSAPASPCSGVDRLYVQESFDARPSRMNEPRSKVPVRALAFVMIGAGASAGQALGQASITGVGDLPGGGFAKSYSQAFAVSGDGSVVVGRCTSTAAGFNGWEAFRWTQSGGIVGLGDLAGSVFSSTAHGVNADGSVVVGIARSTASNTLTEAFRWTAATGMVGLGDVPGGPFGSSAVGVNADGSVIVGNGYTTTAYLAMRWTAATGMVSLGDFAGADEASFATAVSNDGAVVSGYGSIQGPKNRAFRWTSATGLVNLGVLPGANVPDHSQAADVSGDGLVVVGSSNATVGPFTHYEAFRWTAAGGMVGLGDLPGGSNHSGAYATNHDGSVVVGVSEGLSGDDEAFVWTAADGMRPLWDVLVAAGANPAATGWSALTRAMDVSSNGTVIVGWGMRNNEIEGFRAVIPQSAVPGDVNGDGQVNVTDLLAVISAWGPCPAPPTACAADVTHDGQVNVTDLLLVISNWG